MVKRERIFSGEFFISYHLAAVITSILTQAFDMCQNFVKWSPAARIPFECNTIHLWDPFATLGFSLNFDPNSSNLLQLPYKSIQLWLFHSCERKIKRSISPQIPINCVSLFDVRSTMLARLCHSQQYIYIWIYVDRQLWRISCIAYLWLWFSIVACVYGSRAVLYNEFDEYIQYNFGLWSNGNIEK